MLKNKVGNTERFILLYTWTAAFLTSATALVVIASQIFRGNGTYSFNRKAGKVIFFSVCNRISQGGFSRILSDFPWNQIKRRHEPFWRFSFSTIKYILIFFSRKGWIAQKRLLYFEFFFQITERRWWKSTLTTWYYVFRIQKKAKKKDTSQQMNFRE